MDGFAAGRLWVDKHAELRQMRTLSEIRQEKSDEEWERYFSEITQEEGDSEGETRQVTPAERIGEDLRKPYSNAQQFWEEAIGSSELPELRSPEFLRKFAEGALAEINGH